MRAVAEPSPLRWEVTSVWACCLRRVIELLPLGLDLEAKVVVLDGVRTGRLDFRSLWHQDGLEIRRAAYGRLVIVSCHIPRLRDGLLDQPFRCSRLLSICVFSCCIAGHSGL